MLYNTVTIRCHQSRNAWPSNSYIASDFGFHARRSGFGKHYSKFIGFVNSIWLELGSRNICISGLGSWLVKDMQHISKSRKINFDSIFHPHHLYFDQYEVYFAITWIKRKCCFLRLRVYTCFSAWAIYNGAY